MAELNDKNAGPTAVAAKLLKRVGRLEARINRVKFCIERTKDKGAIKEFNDELVFRGQELTYKLAKLKKLMPAA